MNYRIRARLWLAGGMLLVAASFLRLSPPVLAAPSETPAAAFLNAVALYLENDYDKALVAFKNFATDHPYSTALPDAIYYQGWCYSQQGQYQEAINAFQKLITSAYSNNDLAVEALLKEAECYRELKDTKKAIELYRRFQKLYPTSEMLPSAMLGEAWASFKSGNLPVAENIINHVRAQFADNPSIKLDALFLLGNVYTEKKDYVAANKVYRLITQERANPRATMALYLAGEAMFNRGESLAKENHMDQSQQAYRDAINYYKGVRTKAELLDITQQDLSKLITRRGQLVNELGLTGYERRVAAARRLLAQLKTQDDLHSLALFRVANCYQELEMPDEANVVYQYLHEKYPEDRAAEQILYGLFQTYAQRGLAAKAETTKAEFDKKYPNSQLGKNANLAEAEIKFGMHDYRAALPLYDKALLATNQEADLKATIEFRRATCYFNLEEFDHARDAFASLVEKHLDSKIRPDGLFFLGLSHYEIANHSSDTNVAKPNIEAGIKAYEEICAKYPKYESLPLVTFRLGYLDSFAGAYDRDPAGKVTSTVNFDKAIATFQDFVKKWPDYKDQDGKSLAPEAMYQIARNYVSAGRYELAISAYKALVDKFPDHDLAPFCMLEIGTTYAAMNDKPKMVDAFREYVKKYPSHSKVGDVLYAIALELENEKRLDEAVLAYRDIISRAFAAGALTEDSRSAAISAQLHICALLELHSEPKTVIADCEAFLNKFAGDAIAARAMITQITWIFRKSHLIDEATTKLEALSQQYQVNASIRHACIISLIEFTVGEKDFKRANIAVARLLADPDHDKIPANGFLAIADFLFKTGKCAQAKENYEHVFAATGLDAKLTSQANLGLGQTLICLQQFDTAETLLEKALTDPQNCPRCDVEFALGEVKAGQNKITEAVEHYSFALANCKGSIVTESAFKLGNIFFKMVSDKDGRPLPLEKIKENKKLALQYFGRLLFATGPSAEEAPYRSAECYEALGESDRACSAFRGYVKRFPNGKFVDDAKAKITKLCVPKPE